MVCAEVRLVDPSSSMGGWADRRLRWVVVQAYSEAGWSEACFWTGTDLMSLGGY